MTPRRLFTFALLSSLAAACSEEVTTAPNQPAASAAAPLVRATQAPAAAAPKAPSDAPPTVDFQETDFVEGERSRDPFRSFAKSFADEARTKVKSQREVVLDQYSLDELKLVGIVTRIQPERALLVDPTGKGHIIQRGQFVGRAETVQGGQSGADYEINWRVERIRDSDIVLVRDDPTNPDVPSSTRIIPLRTEQEQEQAALQ
ncbi:MAG TPA: pilus assembly protein PilP [Polyangiaceae bacterium]|jgi:type IV pilus assembly protein PilP|nr:pilus assembly protein PilP [Polyangiaceae bacterium]